MKMTERADWMNDAACNALVATHGAAYRNKLFFPEPGAPHAPAKAICRSCPVREQCLDHALNLPEHHGIWGGTSAKERIDLRRELGIKLSTGGQPRPIRHGTIEGYDKCRRRPEGTCPACREAYSRYQNPLARRQGQRAS